MLQLDMTCDEVDEVFQLRQMDRWCEALNIGMYLECNTAVEG